MNYGVGKTLAVNPPLIVLTNSDATEKNELCQIIGNPLKNGIAGRFLINFQ